MKTPDQLPTSEQRAVKPDVSSKAAPIPEEPAPIKLTFRFWAFVSVLVVFLIWVGVIPAVYMLKVKEVPPLEVMQRSTGMLSTEGAGRGKNGVYTVITHSDGSKELFSCRSYAAFGHTCLHPKYRGKTADVRWFWVTTFPGQKHKYPAQIVIDGEAVRDHEKTIHSIRAAHWIAIVMVFVCFAGSVVSIAFWMEFERRKHASVNR